MNYFKYQPHIPMGRVWSLFTQLGELSEEEILGKNYYEGSYSHTLDIVKSALSGSLLKKLNENEEFNLKGYEVRCSINDKNDAIKNVEKLLFIVDSVSDSDDDIRVGFGDVSEKRLKRIEEAFDTIESLESFESSINQLLRIRNEYITTKGIDLVNILSNSLKGIPEALELLSNLVKSDSYLKDLILTLCECGNEGVLLNRLSAVV